MPPVGFEPTISAGEWPQTYTLDCAATETGSSLHYPVKFKGIKNTMNRPGLNVKQAFKTERFRTVCKRGSISVS
jgi:hypothetical protein